MSEAADDSIPQDGSSGARPPVPAGSEHGKGVSERAGPALDLLLFRQAAAESAPPRFERLFSYGSSVALVVCLFGFAWAASSYFPAAKPPAQESVPSKETAERGEILRATQKMAEDISSLKETVDALRTAQSRMAKDTSGFENLKTRLNAVKTETSASIAELAGKVDHLQREPEAKLSQIIERLDRMERQIATAPAAPPSGAPAAKKQAQSGRGDAFDPAQNPNAPGAPHSLGSLVPAGSANPAAGRAPADGERNSRLITNWVVRDVYDGIALVESPRGSIEVIPGETIPGAGTVKAIERRGASWIVITSRGIVDSARDAF